MGQVKIYPSTQAQVQAVQNTVNEINGKITTPTYQVKTVTPSNVQQTVQADSGYTALSGVIVNPIAAAMPENVQDFIMRNDRTENFSISVNGSIPSYACIGQVHLVAVYGELRGVGPYAFNGCTSLQNIDTRNVTSIEYQAFYNCTSLQNIDTRNATSIGNEAFRGCANLQSVDIRKIASLVSNAFYGCASLQDIDIRKVASIGGNVFFNCTNLRLVDCTSCTTPPTIQASTFTNANNSFRVAVATDTEKALFQAATNWSARASQIYTVAEIEALAGMTYDEYYYQCFGHPRNEVTP